MVLVDLLCFTCSSQAAVKRQAEFQKQLRGRERADLLERLAVEQGQLGGGAGERITRTSVKLYDSILLGTVSRPLIFQTSFRSESSRPCTSH